MVWLPRGGGLIVLVVLQGLRLSVVLLLHVLELLGLLLVELLHLLRIRVRLALDFLLLLNLFLFELLAISVLLGAQAFELLLLLLLDLRVRSCNGSRVRGTIVVGAIGGVCLVSAALRSRWDEVRWDSRRC